MRKSILCIIILFSSFPATAQNGLDTLDLKSVFFEPYLEGVRPELLNFSPDMNSVYFAWNDSAYRETGIYQVDLEGEITEKLPDDTVTEYVLSPDNNIVYTKENELFISDTGMNEERVLVSSIDGPANPVWSPDGSSIAYVNEGDVWVMNLKDISLTQVTSRKEETPDYTVEHWAGNDRLILRRTDYSEGRELYFPDYLGKFVDPGSAIRGIPLTEYFVADLDSLTVKILIEDKNRSSTRTSSTGRYLAVDYADAALKERKLRIFNLTTGVEHIVFEDSTKGWLYNRNMQFAPEGEKLMFQSERDNWNHIYTVNPDGSGLKQYTFGKYDIPWAEWVDSSTIIYASNEEDPGVRHLSLLDIQNSQSRKITEDSSYRYQFSLSPAKNYIVYAKTYFNQPYDLYLIDLVNPSDEIRLTRSVPDRFYKIGWQDEDYIRFTGRDGETELSMSVLYPHDFDPSEKYPVVVFAHGAGSLQNVYKGWSNNYYREYMFHQYLIQHEYVVVEVDFRHSTGYGRKFREDVTNWMGRFETQDIIDGLDWLDHHTGGLDLENVGIYGGSYGGFMALYAVSVEPERFHAAAALRAVTNWRNYYFANPWYTKPRLGTPKTDSVNFARSSPLTYSDEVKHPVLILHGLKDDNVGFQEAAQYVEELIRAQHDDFEMMMYPSEAHSFTRPESWYDEYRRIFEFFEKHLKTVNSHQ
ncbi:MAG: S9 family peptidase [Balneolaceae bacterium]